MDDLDKLVEEMRSLLQGIADRNHRMAALVTWKTLVERPKDKRMLEHHSNALNMGHLGGLQKEWMRLFPGRELVSLERVLVTVNNKYRIYWRAKLDRTGAACPGYLWLLDDFDNEWVTGWDPKTPPPEKIEPVVP
jgi:hypothetical protein